MGSVAPTKRGKLYICSKAKRARAREEWVHEKIGSFEIEMLLGVWRSRLVFLPVSRESRGN